LLLIVLFHLLVSAGQPGLSIKFGELVRHVWYGHT
jgi:hypothetical protein